MVKEGTLPSVRLGRVLGISKRKLDDALLKKHDDKSVICCCDNAVQEKNSTDSYCNDILSLKRA